MTHFKTAPGKKILAYKTAPSKKILASKTALVRKAPSSNTAPGAVMVYRGSYAL